MVFMQRYASPLGGLLLAADEQGLIGLWFDGARHFAANLPEAREEKRTPILDEAARWLDDYFSGGQPDFTPPLHLIGSAFRLRVWARLLEIPYGQTTTYGALLGDGASARAVGGAVGRNPISIIVPCHRVIGADGSLTGYAGVSMLRNQRTRMEQKDDKKTAAAPGEEPGAAAVLLCVFLKQIGFIHKNRTVCGKITPPAFPCRFRGCGCAGRI